MTGIVKNLLVSVSGGRTSGHMAYRLKRSMPGHNLLFVFANTGQEHPKTIEFLRRINAEFDLNLFCVEAVVDPAKNKGTKHRVVDINEIHMGGALFESVVSKYGIPNSSYPHCNRELKLGPIHSFAREYFGGSDYDTAIGIRVDEIDRMSSKASENRIIYPLVTAGVTKSDVLAWWSGQAFDLEIPEHYGNCLTCWKKSDRKLKTIALEHPEWFDVFRGIEDRHGWSGNVMDDQVKPRVFFRRYRSVEDIFEEAKEEFLIFTDRGSQMGLFAMDDDTPCTLDCGVDS